MQIVLENFENYLRAKLAQFVMGKQLTQREPELQATFHHVFYHGKLLSVVGLMHFWVGLLCNNCKYRQAAKARSRIFFLRSRFGQRTGTCAYF